MYTNVPQNSNDDLLPWYLSGLISTGMNGGHSKETISEAGGNKYLNLELKMQRRAPTDRT